MFSSYLKRKNNSVLPKRTNEEKSLFSSQVKTPSFLTPRTGTSKDNRFDNPLYLPSSTSSFPHFQVPSEAAPKASEIRENVKNAYESVYKNGKTAKIFDDIDDKTIEDSLKLSKSAIDSNLRLGKINDSFLKSHPYLSDGLTMFYALSVKKKSKEANEARKLAYTAIKNEKISDNPYSPKALYDKGVEKVRERIEKDKKSGTPYREELEKMPDLLGDNLSLDDADLSVKGVYEKSLKSIERQERIRKEKSHIPLDVKHQTQQVFGPNNSGCVLTCISMVFDYFGGKTTPEDLYTANGDSFWTNYNTVLKNTGMDKKLKLTQSEKGVSEDEIYNKCLRELEKGNPVIVEIAYGNSGTHSVLVYGYNGDWNKTSDFDPSDFLAMDPYRTTKNKSDRDGVNTLKHSVDMFKKYGESKIHRWTIYTPKKENDQ